MAREYEGIARALASKGRYGDSMLMHVTPGEVEALQRAVPGGITINPDTGQPEAFIAEILAALGIGLGTTATAAAPVIPFAATVIPTAAELTAAGLSTAAAAAPVIPPTIVPFAAGYVPTAAELAAANLGPVAAEGATAGAEIVASGLPEGMELATVEEALGEGLQLASNFEEMPAWVQSALDAQPAMELPLQGSPGLVAGPEGVTTAGLHGGGVGGQSIGSGVVPEAAQTFGETLNTVLSEGLQKFGTFAGDVGGGIAELPAKFAKLPLEKQIMAGSLAAGAGTMIAEEVAGDEGPPEGWGDDEDPGPSSYAGPASWSGDITGDPSGPAPWAGDITGEASPPFSPAGGGLISPGFDPSASPYVQSGDYRIPELGTEAPLLGSPDQSGYESPPGVYETGGEGLGALAEAVEPLGGGIAEGMPEGMDIGEVMAGFEELKSGLPAMSDITIEEYIAMLNQQGYGGLAYG